MPGDATPPLLGRAALFRVFFLLVFAFLLYQLALIFAPFFTALAGAATLTLIFHPVHRRIRTWCRGREGLAATISTLVLLLVIILPLVGMGWFVATEIAGLMPTVREWSGRIREGGAAALGDVLPPAATELLDKLDRFFSSWGFDVRAFAMKALDRAGEKAGLIGARVVSNVLTVIINVFILVLGLFFFLRDGGRMVRGVVDLVPMETVHKDLLVRRLDETFSAVVQGVFVTAAVQGLLAGIGFSIAGVDLALLLGFVTAFVAVIPFVGAAAVWVPTCIYLFLVGPLWAAIFLLLWGTLVISLVDNILKPILMRDRAQISTFLLFFGILGGLQVYGFLGIFLGPLVIALLLTFAKIYKEQFQGAILQEAEPPEPVDPPMEHGDAS